MPIRIGSSYLRRSRFSAITSTTRGCLSVPRLVGRQRSATARGEMPRTNVLHGRYHAQRPESKYKISRIPSLYISFTGLLIPHFRNHG